MFTLFLVFVIGVSGGDALECAVCNNVTTPTDCTSFQNCSIGERCYTTLYDVDNTVTFALGCMSESPCLSSWFFADPSTGQQNCSQCCELDRCNNDLCSTSNPVDGSWSVWSSWSSCDVTCEEGRMTRSRTCTDPQPADGGLYCVGNGTDYTPCVLGPCPIHGGWNTWQRWGSCSRSCSIGTQSRRRFCDRPTPQLAGNHCFGDPVGFQACFLTSCTDGGWSSWAQWSTCTKGLSTRARSCSNPPPSVFGKGCAGTCEQYKTCTDLVAFTVTSPNGSLVYGRPVFAAVITNLGGGYDTKKERFTCPVPGLYQFTFSVGTKADHRVSCRIHQNGAAVAYAITHGSEYDMASATVYLQLEIGDIVNLGNCYNWNYVYFGYATTFSGVLIQSV